MYIKKIWFNSKSGSGPLYGKEFNFCRYENNFAHPVKFVILIGESGSGKTTILDLIKKFTILFKDPKIINYRNLNFKLNNTEVSCSWSIKRINGSYEEEIEKIKGEKISIFYQDFVQVFLESSGSNKGKERKKECIFLVNNNKPNWFAESYKMLINFGKINLIAKNYDPNNEIQDVKNNIFSLYIEYQHFRENFNIFCKEAMIDAEQKNNIWKKVIRYNRYYFLRESLLEILPLELTFDDCNFNNLERKFTLFKISRPKYGESLIDIKDKIKIEFDNLSSGEKSIFAILLKLLYSNDNSICLLDELENSLYPKYQDLISKGIIAAMINNVFYNKRKNQFFIATHSPLILKNFLLLPKKEYVIINAKTGKNIDDEKKFFFNDSSNGDILYEEILFLYYGIISWTYYLYLYEKLNAKIKVSIKNDDNKIDEFKKYNDFDRWLLMYIEKNKNGENFKFLHEIKFNIDGINYHLPNNHKLKKEDFIHKQSSLTKLRNLIAHGKEEKTYYFYTSSEDNKDLFSEETKKFFTEYNDKSKKDNLLLKLTNILRDIIEHYN